MGSVFPLLFFVVLCPTISWGLQHRSQPALEAYKKYLDDTCQNEKLTDNDYYWEWELHEFLTSLRVQLLPDTADGDLSEFVNSPLIKYLPTSPLERDPRRVKCQREKKDLNHTHTLNTKAESSSIFQDYIIDLMFVNPYERFDY